MQRIRLESSTLLRYAILRFARVLSRECQHRTMELNQVEFFKGQARHIFTVQIKFNAVVYAIGFPYQTIV